MQTLAPEISLQDWLRSRRSVRRFDGRAVSRELVDRILETATYAPNAHNRQPWRFVVLESDEAKTKLASAMSDDFREALHSEGHSQEEIETQIARSRARITEAPLGVLLCADLSVMDTYSDEKRQQGEHAMAMQSVALAGGQLLLAAHAEGLGGVWMCAPLFVPEIVQQALDLDESWQPQGLVLLGYPATQPAARERLPIEKVTRFL
ncbi:MAG: nitroreductase family protein [Chloroflexi bacterium]|nr:MAG: nitroreductase family protein [Chloroflexota bacterium]MBL1195960.1 nitroreductase family protein [Chloroflexota bacterium]